jgi:hypothetical protein
LVFAAVSSMKTIRAGSRLMKERRSYYKLAGHCTRCHEPFGGNATAFMVSESVIWQVLGTGGLPVCARRA